MWRDISQYNEPKPAFVLSQVHPSLPLFYLKFDPNLPLFYLKFDPNLPLFYLKFQIRDIQLSMFGSIIYRTSAKYLKVRLMALASVFFCY